MTRSISNHQRLGHSGSPTEKIAVPTLLRRAGLPASSFQQEKIYVTTAEVFALWRSVAEMSPDPGFGLKLGTELRFERSHPVVDRRCLQPDIRRCFTTTRSLQTTDVPGGNSRPQKGAGNLGGISSSSKPRKLNPTSWSIWGCHGF